MLKKISYPGMAVCPRFIGCDDGFIAMMIRSGNISEARGWRQPLRLDKVIIAGSLRFFLLNLRNKCIVAEKDLMVQVLPQMLLSSMP